MTKPFSEEEFSKLSIEEQDALIKKWDEDHPEIRKLLDAESPNDDEYRCAMFVRFEEVYNERFNDTELSELDRARGKRVLEKYPDTADTITKLFKLIDKIEGDKKKALFKII